MLDLAWVLSGCSMNGPGGSFLRPRYIDEDFLESEMPSDVGCLQYPDRAPVPAMRRRCPLRLTSVTHMKALMLASALPKDQDGKNMEKHGFDPNPIMNSPSCYPKFSKFLGPELRTNHDKQGDVPSNFIKKLQEPSLRHLSLSRPTPAIFPADQAAPLWSD